MFRKILVPVDVEVLERGEAILRKAVSLVDEGGDIILLNVVEDLPGYLAIDIPVDMIEAAIADAKEKLAGLKAKVTFPVRVEIRSGSPAREILAAAGEHGADLIIVASHMPDISNYFIGATADRVVRHAKCSVLIDR